MSRRCDSFALQRYRPGHANAQYSLGGMLGNGQGVALDRAEGMHWLRMAAAQGHFAAIMVIGMMALTVNRYAPHDQGVGDRPGVILAAENSASHVKIGILDPDFPQS
jgi:TPR repeat protein